MNRPIFYDSTQAFGDPDRTEFFDRRFAQSLLRDPTVAVEFILSDARGLTRLPDSARKGFVREDDEEGTEAAYAATRAWILDRGSASAARTRRKRSAQSWLPQRRGPALEVPQGGVFLKIGLAGWDGPRLSAFLERRSDILVVAVLRDLWELEFPEYASAKEAQAAARASAALERRANAVVRLSDRTPGAVLAPAPSAIADAPPAPLDRELAEEPYFVHAGPIEARANTLLLLQIWREFAHSGAPVPKLVLAGARSAQIDSIAPMLDWSESIRPYVVEAPHLGPHGLRRLLVHARGLLVPDFAGPDVALARDARALGTRLIASAIPTFSEKAGGRFERLDPIAGPRWRESILRAANEPPRRVPDDAALPTWLDWRRKLFAYVAGL